MPTSNDALLSASVILLRQGKADIELLLAKRRLGNDFTSSAWVFAGGLVDPADRDQRDTVVRETLEELNVTLDPEALVRYQRWITPAGLPKRFDTQFFVAAMPEGVQVCIDNDEIVDSMWWPLKQVEALFRSRQYKVLFPTYIAMLTLHKQQITSVRPLLQWVERNRHPTIQPRLEQTANGSMLVIPPVAGVHSHWPATA